MKVYLIASTRLEPGLEEFLADRSLALNSLDTPTEAERLVEAAGRVCYMSFAPRQRRPSNREYIDNLIRQGHESVLEHAQFSLLIDGISRALSHQLVRHRAGFSYSQLSQQYHDETSAEFVTPPCLVYNDDLRQKWESLVAQSRALYQDLLRAKFEDAQIEGFTPKEKARLQHSCARMALLNAAQTTIAVTGNARAWRYALRVRGSIKGDLEMRTYCVAVYKVLSCAAPNLFSGFSVASDKLGDYIETKSHG